MADWSDELSSYCGGEPICRDAPAGGGGPGRFATAGTSQHASKPASGGASLPPRAGAPASRWTDWFHLPHFTYYDRAKDVYEAMKKASDFVWDEVLVTTGYELEGVLEGFLPGLEKCLAYMALSTVAGAGAGAALGALAGGVGALPGAVAGADAGLEICVLIMTYFGLKALIPGIRKHMSEGVDCAVKGVSMAWHAADNPGSEQAVVVMAAHQFARALALFIQGILESIVAVLLAKGGAGAAARVGGLASDLSASGLGPGFAEWVTKNWPDMVKNPKLLPSAESGANVAKGADAEAAESATAARPKPQRAAKAPEEPEPPEQPASKQGKAAEASDLEGSEYGGVKAQRVLPGSPDKVAVIGRSMQNAVEPYAKGLSESGSPVETFSGSQISPEATADWNMLKKQYAPDPIPESALRDSQMFKENQAWATKLKNKGYTVVDVGNPAKQGASPFYDMEKQVLFGDGK